eukprot:m.208900 g.208900  ORF g.208900 m.208900 type:complete len:353 (+) comp24299_c0_seq1:404-1462(+)
MRHVLCADIGGTNSRLQLHGSRSDTPASADSGWTHTDFDLVGERILASDTFTSLGALVKTFLDTIAFEGTVDAACIAVCGPVANEERMCGPVLPEQPPTQWGAKASDVVSGALEGRVLKAVLINDFIGVGLGLTALGPDDVVTLHDVPKVEGAPMACVGAGTGLGEVFLTWEASRKQYKAWSSEGGMTPFNAHSEEEWALRNFCVARNGQATVESVVSGPGLRNTFHYLVSTGQPDNITTNVAPDDVPKVIADAGLARSDPVAVAALDMMLRAWAAELRSVCLRTMPFAGLYLAGGLAPKLLPAIQSTLVPAFLEADPLMASILVTCPLFAVTNDLVGLLGAKVRAVQLLEE